MAAQTDSQANACLAAPPSDWVRLLCVPAGGGSWGSAQDCTRLPPPLYSPKADPETGTGFSSPTSGLDSQGWRGGEVRVGMARLLFETSQAVPALLT